MPDASGWLGVDVGVRNSVVTSDGRRSRSLHRIIRIEKQRRAAQQRAAVNRSKGMSYQRQALDKEAVSVARKTGLGLALEDPKRLIRWKQHAARWLANRVGLLAAISAVPVRLVNPAWTCPWGAF